jgi:hypothetical protein
MRKITGQIIMGLVLMAASAAIFFWHFEIYHDKKFIIDWMLGSLAFLPVSVIVVSLILDRIIAAREKEILLNKLNMVIGAFFSEAGNGLLKMLVKNVTLGADIRPSLLINGKWGKSDFKAAGQKLKGYMYGFEAGKINLPELSRFLTSKRGFLLRLLENQNLLEHETFTDLLWSVFHITEELESRKTLKKLKTPDLVHISGDLQRAFVLLVVEWMGYMGHLKEQYPYLFSLAVRTNPFDAGAKAEIS